jgi:hypothetical protein
MAVGSMAEPAQLIVFTIRMEQNGSSAMQNAVGYVLYEQGEPLD